MREAAPISPRGRSKGDKRTRTRARLLTAAAEVIGEKGFEGTTLADVAARAGMTRGAIYGNFRDKEDLFLAVAETYWNPIMPPFEPGASFPAQIRALGEAVAAVLPMRERAAVGAASLQLYTLRSEAMRKRIVSQNRDTYRQIAEAMAESKLDGELPLPADVMVRVLHAVIEGLFLRRALTPELIGDEVVRGAFELIARGSGRSGG